ncbi:hypothetical protein [Arthrobacter sp. UM1]|uniref:hypothetical protein n=1 Tax=Arthrobacter sp. UM1 TaxID=2766776 RepID=UPI001CF69622|nr:hypothetical protein [Arthrobacter sp. UM1]MCB4208784.1 hypothetical protein [Arthrobacter sp. UM1]
MGTTIVYEFTAAEALREVEALKGELAMPMEAAEQLAAAGALEPEQYSLYRRIHDLAWLLKQ